MRVLTAPANIFEDIIFISTSTALFRKQQEGKVSKFDKSQRPKVPPKTKLLIVYYLRLAGYDILKSVNEIATRRPALLVLLLLFIVALVPRLIGLQWGLPTEQRWYSYHPDEREIAFAVGSLDFFGGDFNPNFFNYPSLYIYLTYIVHVLANGLELMGTTQAPASNAPAVWPLLHDIILSGRVVTAVLGAATVPLVYLLGREISGHRVGLLAALLLALLPGHVQHSHFATVDVPMTFFVALSLWLATRALRQYQEVNDRQHEEGNPHVSRSRLKLLLLAAFAVGLAAATKYNGVLVLAAPLAALFALKQRHWLSNAGLLIGTAALGFLIGCPYSILSFREFWGDGKNLGFAYELFVHPRLGSGEIFQNTGNGWWYHLTFNLPFVMTVPVLAVVLAGLFATVAAVRDKDHDRVLKKALILPITASLLYSSRSVSRKCDSCVTRCHCCPHSASSLCWESSFYHKNSSHRHGPSLAERIIAALSVHSC
jgi:4-amino-4-deoxy-L-arabinose transferase-like glycosyltransferase